MGVSAALISRFSSPSLRSLIRLTRSSSRTDDFGNFDRQLLTIRVKYSSSISPSFLGLVIQFLRTPLCFGVQVAKMVAVVSGAGIGSSSLKSLEYIIFKERLDSTLPGC